MGTTGLVSPATPFCLTKTPNTTLPQKGTHGDRPVQGSSRNGRQGWVPHQHPMRTYCPQLPLGAPLQVSTLSLFAGYRAGERGWGQFSDSCPLPRCGGLETHSPEHGVVSKCPPQMTFKRDTFSISCSFLLLQHRWGTTVHLILSWILKKVFRGKKTCTPSQLNLSGWFQGDESAHPINLSQSATSLGNSTPFLRFPVPDIAISRQF